MGTFQKKLIPALILILAFPSTLWAFKLTYSGRILKPDNTPLEASSVQFVVQIKSAGADQCLLYKEIHTIPMANSEGIFSLKVGAGTRGLTETTEDGGNNIEKIFANTGSLNLPTCAGNAPGTFTPNVGDGRILEVTFNDGTGVESLGQQEINHVPMALEAAQVSGYGVDQLLRVDSGTTTPLTVANFGDLLKMLTAASSVSIGQSIYFDGTNWAPFTPGSATAVTSVGTGTGLTGGPIDIGNPTGTISLANTAVTPGSYGSSSQVSTFTVDQQGRLTSASSSAISITESNITGTLDRTKVATGTPDHVLINDGSGNLSSEAALSVSRGGTGLSTFTANSLLMANGTGSAITSATCTMPGDILVWQGGGFWGCEASPTAGGGTIPVSAGGTGASSIPANNMVVMDAAGTAMTGIAPLAGAIPYGDGTQWTAVSAAALAAHGKVKFVYQSSTAVKLVPYQGNGLIINGVLRQVPPSGVTLSTTGLSASTTYYVYAYMSGVNITLEASTTAYTNDITYGHEIKNGDATRTLVAMVRTNGATQFVDTASQRFVRSWYNRGTLLLKNSPGNVTHSGALAAKNEYRIETLAWNKEGASQTFTGLASVSAAGSCALNTNLDGVLGDSFMVQDTSGGGQYRGMSGVTQTVSLTEGYHYFELSAAATGGTCTFQISNGLTISNNM